MIELNCWIIWKHLARFWAKLQMNGTDVLTTSLLLTRKVPFHTPSIWPRVLFQRYVQRLGSNCSHGGCSPLPHIDLYLADHGISGSVRCQQFQHSTSTYRHDFFSSSHVKRLFCILTSSSRNPLLLNFLSKVAKSCSPPSTYDQSLFTTTEHQPCS